jgi:hypothetical protein
MSREELARFRAMAERMRDCFGARAVRPGACGACLAALWRASETVLALIGLYERLAAEGDPEDGQ